jgi:hypothetical protein
MSSTLPIKIARLDALSRQRALTDRESYELERAIYHHKYYEHNRNRSHLKPSNQAWGWAYEAPPQQ